MKKITESYVEFETMRSGGPGGQHADRSATAVRLRVPIERLPLTDPEEQLVKKYLPDKNKTTDDELLVEVGESRSQKRNREKAVEVANNEVRSAIETGLQKQKKKDYEKRVKQQSRGGGGGEEDIHEKKKKRRRSETTDDLLEEALEEAPETMERYFEGQDDEQDNTD